MSLCCICYGRAIQLYWYPFCNHLFHSQSPEQLMKKVWSILKLQGTDILFFFFSSISLNKDAILFIELWRLFLSHTDLLGHNKKQQWHWIEFLVQFKIALIRKKTFDRFGPFIESRAYLIFTLWKMKYFHFYTIIIRQPCKITAIKLELLKIDYIGANTIRITINIQLIFLF